MLVAKYEPGIKGNISHQVPADLSSIPKTPNIVRSCGVESEGSKPLCTLFVTFSDEENKEITSAHVFQNLKPQLYPETRKTVYKSTKDIKNIKNTNDMSLSSPSTFTDDEYHERSRVKKIGKSTCSTPTIYDRQMVQEVSLSYSAPYTAVARPHQPLAVQIDPTNIDGYSKVYEENGNVHSYISGYDTRFENYSQITKKGESVERLLKSGKIETEFPVNRHLEEIPYFSAQSAIQSARTTPAHTPRATPIVDSRASTVRLPSSLSHDTIVSQSTTIEELTTVRTLNNKTSKRGETNMPTVNLLTQQFEARTEKKNGMENRGSPQKISNVNNNFGKSTSRVVVINKSNQYANHRMHSPSYVPAAFITTTVVDIEPPGYGRRALVEEYRIEEEHRTMRTYGENHSEQKRAARSQQTAEEAVEVYVRSKSRSGVSSRASNERIISTEQQSSPTVRHVIEHFETKIEESSRPVSNKENIPKLVTRIDMNTTEQENRSVVNSEIVVTNKELHEQRGSDGRITWKASSPSQILEENNTQYGAEHEIPLITRDIIPTSEELIQTYEETNITSLQSTTPEPLPDTVSSDLLKTVTIGTSEEVVAIPRNEEISVILPLPQSAHTFKSEVQPPPPTPVSPIPKSEVARILEETITTITEKSTNLVQVVNETPAPEKELEPEEKEEKNKKAAEEKKRRLDYEKREIKTRYPYETLSREWNHELRVNSYEELLTSRRRRETSVPVRSNRSTIQTSNYGGYSEGGFGYHSGATVASGLASAGSICTTKLRDDREREKRELGLLNDRLADYIEKVRFLEAQNRVLSHDIDILNKGFLGGNNIDSLYNHEITSTKSRIVEISSSKGHIEKEISVLTAQIEEIKLKWRKAVESVRAHREDHDVDLNKLAKIEADIALFKRKIRIVEEDVIRVRRENDSIHSNIAHIRSRLHNEVAIKNEHRLRHESLLHRIKELQVENSTRIDQELRIFTRETIADNREYFRRELRAAMMDIRSNYEEISRRSAMELEKKYHEEIKIIRSHYDSGIVHREKEVLVNIRQEVTRIRMQVSETESRNHLLQRMVSDLNEQLNTEPQYYLKCLEEKDSLIADLRNKCREMSIEMEKLCDHQITLRAEIERYRTLLGSANVTTYTSSAVSGYKTVTETDSHTSSHTVYNNMSMRGGRSEALSIGGTIGRQSGAISIGGNIERKPDRIHDDEGEDEAGRKFRSWYKGTIRVRQVSSDFIELENICIIRRVDVTGFRIEHRLNGTLLGETTIHRPVTLDPKQTLRIYTKNNGEFFMDVNEFNTSVDSRTSLFNITEPTEERGWFTYLN